MSYRIQPWASPGSAPAQGWGRASTFLNLPDFRSVALVSATFSYYGSFCANYTKKKKMEKMSLTLQRTQIRLALNMKIAHFFVKQTTQP